MVAKVPKCQCVVLQASTEKLVDPQLHLNGASIPFTQDPVHFLGLDMQLPSQTNSARPQFISKLEKTVDRMPLTKQQKLLMYTAGVCPRLIWPLLTQEFPLSWVEAELDSLATRYIKRWAGLTKSANTSILFLPHSLGGLNLPQLSTVYRKLQVSRQIQLLTSYDGCVRFMADQSLKREQCASRAKFQPATQANEVLKTNIGGSRKALTKAAKTLVTEDTNDTLLQCWQGLERQGHMRRCLDDECARVWANVVTTLPEERMSFAPNAAVNVLPHNANYTFGGKSPLPPALSVERNSHYCMC